MDWYAEIAGSVALMNAGGAATIQLKQHGVPAALDAGPADDGARKHRAGIFGAQLRHQRPAILGDDWRETAIGCANSA